MTTLTREVRGIRHYRRETADLDLAPQVATDTADDGTLTATITPQATLLHADVETRETPYGAPGSFVRDSLPANVAVNTDEQAAVAAAFAPAVMDKLGAARISVDVFAPYVEIAEPGASLVPVWLGAWPAVANKWEVAKNAILRQGIPINLDAYLEFYANAVARGDTDLSVVVFDPEWVSWDDELHGSEHGAWRLRPGTPEIQAAGYPLQCSNGYRIRGTQESPGYAITRPSGKRDPATRKLIPQAGWDYSRWPTSYPYPASTTDVKAYPSDPEALDVFETPSSASVSGVAAGGLIITVEDVQRALELPEDEQAFEHPIGLAAPYTLIRSGNRWPATANDGGGTTAPLQEGMRYRLDPELHVTAAGLHPLAAMVARTIQRRGALLTDKGTIVGCSAQRGVESLFPNSRRGTKGELMVFHAAAADPAKGYIAQARFPWQSLQLLATGTETTPNPVAT